MKHVEHTMARTVTRWVLGLLLALSLGGCASVFSAQVTRYEQWPSGTEGAQYWIQPDASQRNNLQFETYADSLRAAMGSTGLVEAASETQARFIVHMEYASPRDRVWEPRFVDPYFYGGFYGPYPGFYRPWGFYGPAVQDVPSDVYRLTLSVRLDDQSQGGREVYRATSVAISRQAQLGKAMPYLARALFDGFPGRNGQTIQVRYPRQ